jgi:predicted DNA-binding transcriptional regulator AlpA
MSVLARPEPPEELPMLGDSEISLLLGLTPARISQLVRAEQMPQPRQRLSMGPVWMLEEIFEWALNEGREIVTRASNGSAKHSGGFLRR